MTEQEKREKVIEGLEHELQNRGKCGHYCHDGIETVSCEYDKYGLCIQHWGNDAIAMLKAQEPIEPVVDVDVWRCGNCGHVLEHQEMIGNNILFHEQYAYCPNCGRPVKWDG